jgi:hypothetical protein
MTARRLGIVMHGVTGRPYDATAADAAYATVS